MNNHYQNVKSNRKFVDSNLEITDWDSVKSYFQRLKDTKFNSIDDVYDWLIRRSELESVLEEDMAWRYIKMSCDTQAKELAEHFNDFVTKVEPQTQKEFNELDKKLYESEFFTKLDENKYFILTRSLKNRIELFREENIPIFSELQVEEQKYGAITGKMTVEHNGDELTFQQANNLLKETDRSLREITYKKILDRRAQDYSSLDDLLASLISKRNTVAKNAGFNNYRDYKYSELGRFDYGVKEVHDFHKAIREVVCPIIDKIDTERKDKLGYDVLHPWDMDVDINLKPGLKPFSSTDELVVNTIKCFNEIHPDFAQFITVMNKNGYLDLGSRIGKAPGGFNYPLYESNIPFIFMNATNNLRDLETMVHEGGHAVHSFLSKDLPLVTFKNLPAEVAELASMSMELISMEHWDIFFNSEEELRRAKISQLQGVLKVLPWVATVDNFQDWLYTNINHTSEQRKDAWLNIFARFGSKVTNWSNLAEHANFLWQRQLHIYQVPFYYIEYGIAQLGAIAMWKNYKEHGKVAINKYINALSLGYSKTIPEIYKEAGIEFSFNVNYVKENIQFVENQLDILNRKA